MPPLPAEHRVSVQGRPAHGGAAAGSTVDNSAFGLSERLGGRRSVLSKIFETAAKGTRIAGGTLHRVSRGAEPLRQALVNEMIDEVLSPAVESSLGLPLSDLLAFNKKFYRDLALGREHESPLYRALLIKPPVFVDLPARLDPDREMADRITVQAYRVLSGRAERGEAPEGLRPELLPVWERLMAHHAAGRPLIDIVLDDDPAAQSPAEVMAFETVAGCIPHADRLIAAHGRHVWTRDALLPFLERTNPEVAVNVHRILDVLEPRWLRGGGVAEAPFGYDLEPDRIDEAYERLMGPFLREDGSLKDPAEHGWDASLAFIDTLNVLDGLSLSGPQTYWIKLLRELSKEKRERLLELVSRVLRPVMYEGATSEGEPLDAPAYRPTHYHQGDRMIDLVRRGLDGLGIRDREVFAEGVHRAVVQNEADLERWQRRIERLGRGSKGARFSLWQILKHRSLPDLASALNTDPRLRTAFRASLERSQEILERYGDLLDPADRLMFRRYLHAMELLELSARVPSRVVIDDRLPIAMGSTPVLLGEFSEVGRDRVPVAAAMLERTRAAPPEDASARPRLGVSVVIEGGGGKGLAYPAVLDRLQGALRRIDGLDATVDEWIGTSAGAITAAFSAAGYSPDELISLSSALRLPNFFSDYLGLMGGLDPEVRGVDRNGVFSTRAMYDTFHRLLSEKLGIQDGGPVFFKDLPSRLKLVATVASTDLPAEVREQLGIQPDGTIVFSKETTPMMDVAAAMTASAAVPMFFQAPQIRVLVPDGEGGVRQHRLQLLDGGVVNNFPASLSARPDRGGSPKGMMLMLPVYHQAPGGAGGRVELSTLDFDPGARVDAIDAHNRERLEGVEAALPRLLQAAREKGYERATLALNLSTLEGQAAPILQGRSPKQTGELGLLAKAAGLDTMSIKKGRRVYKDQHQSAGLADRLGQYVYDALFDKKKGVYSPGRWGAPRRYEVPEDELASFGSVGLSMIAAALVTKTRYREAKTFESA